MPGPNAPYTKLDSAQVLTQSFDESKDRLRVDIGADISLDGDLEVAINESEDSIAVFGADPAGAHRAVRTSEQGSISVDGVYNATLNTDPSNVGVVAQDRNVAASDTRQTIRPTGKRGTTATDTVSLDVSLHDHNGNPLDGTNPFSVVDVGLTRASAPVRHDYSSINVTTAAYVELVASTSAVVRKILLTDTSGRALYLAFGAAGLEVDQIFIPNGVSDQVFLAIPAGTRLSIKAVDATANSGHLLISFLV